MAVGENELDALVGVQEQAVSHPHVLRAGGEDARRVGDGRHVLLVPFRVDDDQPRNGGVIAGQTDEGRAVRLAASRVGQQDRAGDGAGTIALDGWRHAVDPLQRYVGGYGECPVDAVSAGGHLHYTAASRPARIHLLLEDGRAVHRSIADCARLRYVPAVSLRGCGGSPEDEEGEEKPVCHGSAPGRRAPALLFGTARSTGRAAPFLHGWVREGHVSVIRRSKSAAGISVGGGMQNGALGSSRVCPSR